MPACIHMGRVFCTAIGRPGGKPRSINHPRRICGGDSLSHLTNDISPTPSPHQHVVFFPWGRNFPSRLLIVWFVKLKHILHTTRPFLCSLTTRKTLKWSELYTVLYIYKNLTNNTNYIYLYNKWYSDRNSENNIRIKHNNNNMSKSECNSEFSLTLSIVSWNDQCCWN